MVLGAFAKLYVGTSVVVTIAVKLEKLPHDKIDGLTFCFIEGAADPIQHRHIARQRRGRRIVVIEQEAIGAVLD